MNWETVAFNQEIKLQQIYMPHIEMVDPSRFDFGYVTQTYPETFAHSEIRCAYCNRILESNQCEGCGAHR